MIAYCISYETMRRAYRMMKGSKGLFIKTESGYVQQSQALSVVIKAMKEMRSFATEFGMTPSARVGLNSGDGMLPGSDEPGEGDDEAKAEAEYFGETSSAGREGSSSALTH